MEFIVSFTMVLGNGVSVHDEDIQESRIIEGLFTKTAGSLAWKRKCPNETSRLCSTVEDKKTNPGDRPHGKHLHLSQEHPKTTPLLEESNRLVLD